MEGNKQMEYEEINLMDYVKVIIKRKKLVAVIFIVAVATAGAINFVLPKVYKVDVILGVGNLGNLIEDPAQVKQKVNSDIYGVSIREKLSISEDNYPKIEAENLKDTNLIAIKIESDKTRQAEDILKEVSGSIIVEHQEKTKSQMDLIDKNMKTIAEKIKLIQENIKNTESKTVLIDADIERLENKIKHVDEEKVNLEAKVDSLQKVLPYQQDPGAQFALFDTKEKLAEKKQEIENLYMEINSLRKQKGNLQIEVNALKKEIENLNSEIDSLNMSKSNIKETQIIRQPMVSKKQISPRPVLNIGIAAVLGLFIGVFAVFGKEWWGKNAKEMKNVKF